MSSHPHHQSGSGCGPALVIGLVLMALVWLWGYWTGLPDYQSDPLGHIVREILKEGQ